MHLCPAFLWESLLADGRVWDHKPSSSNTKKLRPTGNAVLSTARKVSDALLFCQSVPGLDVLTRGILSGQLKYRHMCYQALLISYFLLHWIPGESSLSS